MIRALLILVLAALPAAAQKLAWKAEVTNAESVESIASDGAGGCVAVVRSPFPNGQYRAVWYSNKGIKKGDEFLPAFGQYGSGPFMVSASRFYVVLSNDGENFFIRRFDWKKGAVTHKDTPLAAGEFIRPTSDSIADKSGFFVAPVDPGPGTTSVSITRYTH